jgi:hypothetical protein
MNNHQQHSQQESAQKPLSLEPSLSTSKKGFGVAASPFNGVKMELGFALFLGFLLWLAADSITASIATQLLLLVSYGLISAGWLVIRTRRVLQQWRVQQWNEQNNQKTTPESDQPNIQHGGSKE